MQRIAYMIAILTIAVAGCGGSGGGTSSAPPEPAFALSRAAAPAEDPEGTGGEVVAIDTSGTTQAAGDPLSAGSIHALVLPASLADLSGKLSVSYYFEAGKGCIAGSPRAHIRLDTDADGTADVELWGALGPDPSAGSPCVAETWTAQDFTDDVARWSASTGGGLVPWADLVAGVSTPYTIVDLFLVEDAEFYDHDADPATPDVPVGVLPGVTYYDDFRVGDETLSDHAQARPAAP